jgi:hypothetical protein
VVVDVVEVAVDAIVDGVADEMAGALTPWTDMAERRRT